MFVNVLRHRMPERTPMAHPDRAFSTRTALVPTAGAFTPDTVAAVQDLQGKLGVAVASDGTVTDPTWEALGVPLRQGDSGNAVTALQSILLNKGYAMTVGGVIAPEFA